jgi:hypothetical protein
MVKLFIVILLQFYFFEIDIQEHLDDPDLEHEKVEN